MKNDLVNREEVNSLLKPKKSMANPKVKTFGGSGMKEKYVNSRHVSVDQNIVGIKQLFNHS
jgi:hypothetical protein